MVTNPVVTESITLEDWIRNPPEHMEWVDGKLVEKEPINWADGQLVEKKGLTLKQGHCWVLVCG